MVNEPDWTRSERSTEPAAALRLRSEGPPVMRLSRKVLTGLVGAGAVVIAGALIWALYQGNGRPAAGRNSTTPKPR